MQIVYSANEQSHPSHKCLTVSSPEGGSSFPQVTRRGTCSMLAAVLSLFPGGSLGLDVKASGSASALFLRLPSD